MNSKTWRPEDGHLLHSLRTSAGLDAFVFARQNTLSLAQLKELESGVGHHFYNETIKRHAGVKLLKKLGYELPEPTPQALDTSALAAAQEPSQAPTPVDTPPSPADIRRSSPSRWAKTHPALWMGSLFTTGLVALVMLQGPTPSPAGRPQISAMPNGHEQPAWPATANALQAAAMDAQPPTAAHLADQPAPPVPGSAVPGSAVPGSAVPGSAVPVAESQALPAAQEHASTRMALTACDHAHRNNSPYHTPSNPIKPGNYVYFEARSDSQLCVLDSQNKLSVLTLRAGMTHTVNGLAPFLLHASDWQGLQVFFQGRPVRIEHGNSAHLVLNSLPL
jgi:hypothetical protein